MPLTYPVDFNAAYQSNQGGSLAQDQIQALKQMLKARILTGSMLFFCDLLMTLLFLSVVFTGDWEAEFSLQLILLFFGFLSLAGVVYGFKIWQSAREARTQLSTIAILKIVGEAKKYNYGVAMHTPVGVGTTHGLVLRHGYLKINGEKYGVLSPKLYGEITEGKKTDFFVVPIGGTGFAKGVVVNCSN